MFRNRYISFNPHHSFIRRRHGKISLQLLNDRNTFENIYGNDNYMEYEPGENNNELDEPDLNEYELDEYDEFDEENGPDDVVDEYENESNVNEEYVVLDENEEELEDHDELGENEEVLVDESLKSEKMPHVDGEFAPYFSNITETLMFCWVQKHSICKLQLFDQNMNDFSVNLYI